MRAFTTSEYVQACARAAAVAPAFLLRPYLPTSRVLAYQLAKLRRLLEHAYANTELYREKYRAAGLSPRDLRSLADLALFPTVTKDELIHAIAAGGLGKAPGPVIHSLSSGSSGKVIDVAHSVSETHPYALGRHRILNMHGKLSPFDLTFYVYTSEFPGRSFFGLYPSTFVHTHNPIPDTVRRIEAARPQVLCAYPSRMMEIADQLSPRQARALRLKLISLNSEMSSRAQRDTLAAHFGCPVLDEFSSEELGWVAAECLHGHYHLFEDMAYVEILSPAADTPAASGEIVGTNLHNLTTPFIRYRQGDLGSIGPEGCACGRGFRLLTSFEGRKNDAFRFPDRTLSPAVLLDSVYALLLTRRFPIQDFCLLQLSPTRVRFEVRAATPITAPLRAEIASALAPFFPPEVQVEVSAPATLHKTRTGKRNPIVCLLP